MSEPPDFADRTDFADADRGLVAPPAAATVTGADGRVVWDFGATGFLDGECPETAHRACGGSRSRAPARGCTR